MKAIDGQGDRCSFESGFAPRSLTWRSRGRECLARGVDRGRCLAGGVDRGRCLAGGVDRGRCLASHRTSSADARCSDLGYRVSDDSGGGFVRALTIRGD